MMNFGLRFDFRNPDIAETSMADRYAAALDMVAWAEDLGCASVSVSEHHGSADGYLPSPLIMLAAMAARTTTMRFMVAALIAPFHDPLRLAEDLAVLDNISKGRVDLVVAGGYAHHEFDMFDIPRKERGARVTETMTTLRSAFTGAPFEFRGRTVQVTPAPFRPGGPALMLGGSSEAAARRAARIADGFLPSIPGVWDFYRDEMVSLGKADPGPERMGRVTNTALAIDVDKGWELMAPFFEHETNAYGIWNATAGMDSPYQTTPSRAALRATGQYQVITPEAFIAEQKAAPFAYATFHPMCGGMPIDLAWSSLKLFENEVLPAFA